MFDVLASSPLLTIMLVVALGTLLGAVPFGPVRFGAADRVLTRRNVVSIDTRTLVHVHRYRAGDDRQHAGRHHARRVRLPTTDLPRRDLPFGVLHRRPLG